MWESQLRIIYAVGNMSKIPQGGMSFCIGSIKEPLMVSEAAVCLVWMECNEQCSSCSSVVN